MKKKSKATHEMISKDRKKNLDFPLYRRRKKKSNKKNPKKKITKYLVNFKQYAIFFLLLFFPIFFVSCFSLSFSIICFFFLLHLLLIYFLLFYFIPLHSTKFYSTLLYYILLSLLSSLFLWFFCSYCHLLLLLLGSLIYLNRIELMHFRPQLFYHVLLLYI
ncbi:hypothetical protein F4703DRAFT_1886865 [Phycomyces blakesleeanus]